MCVCVCISVHLGTHPHPRLTGSPSALCGPLGSRSELRLPHVKSFINTHNNVVYADEQFQHENIVSNSIKTCFFHFLQINIQPTNIVFYSERNSCLAHFFNEKLRYSSFAVGWGWGWRFTLILICLISGCLALFTSDTAHSRIDR